MKLTLVLAALALAMPVVASAERPRKTAQTLAIAAENAVLACKAEHATAGAAAFAREWGTFSRCYAARRSRALAAKLFQPAILTLPCRVGDSPCSASGIVAGRPVRSGTLTAAYAVDWTHSGTNGLGGVCAAATATLVTTNRNPANTLTTFQKGKLCEVRRTGEHFFFGTYTVTSGTGSYAKLRGSGLAAFDQLPDGTLRAVQIGTLRSR